MITAQKSLKQKNSVKNCIPEEVFSLYFLLQDFPPTMMPFWLFLQKVQKIRKCRSYETWAVEILQPQDRKIGPAMSRPLPSSDLAPDAEGGRDRALDMATNSPKLKCLINLSKKVNIFI
jgi:hypothetical protein